jgi:hypothetical protein
MSAASWPMVAESLRITSGAALPRARGFSARAASRAELSGPMT